MERRLIQAPLLFRKHRVPLAVNRREEFTQHTGEVRGRLSLFFLCTISRSPTYDRRTVDVDLLGLITSSLFTTIPPDTASVAIPLWMDLLAAATGSVGGALIAREYKLDLLGGIAMGITTGLGGGLLRDMILQVGNVYILREPLAIPVCAAAAAAVLLFPRAIANQDRLFNLLDIFAVGLFAAIGADKALVRGFEPAVCIIMGFFTAVGGGMLRDICINRTPAIFRKSNLYALAAIAGSCAFLVAAWMLHLQKVGCAVVCVAVTMGLRYFSLHFNIQSPDPDDLDLSPVVAKPIRSAKRAITKKRRH